jgi:hypothetical protein
MKVEVNFLRLLNLKGSLLLLLVVRLCQLLVEVTFSVALQMGLVFVYTPLFRNRLSVQLVTKKNYPIAHRNDENQTSKQYRKEYFHNDGQIYFGAPNFYADFYHKAH